MYEWHDDTERKRKQGFSRPETVRFSSRTRLNRQQGMMFLKLTNTLMPTVYLARLIKRRVFVRWFLPSISPRGRQFLFNRSEIKFYCLSYSSFLQHDINKTFFYLRFLSAVIYDVLYSYHFSFHVVYNLLLWFSAIKVLCICFHWFINLLCLHMYVQIYNMYLCIYICIHICIEKILKPITAISTQLNHSYGVVPNYL